MKHDYPQADPPDPVTCTVYLAAFLFLLVLAGWVLLHVSGVI
jgi:hypothetical protein